MAAPINFTETAYRFGSSLYDTAKTSTCGGQAKSCGSNSDLLYCEIKFTLIHESLFILETGGLSDGREEKQVPVIIAPLYLTGNR